MGTKYLALLSCTILLSALPLQGGETEDNDGHEVSARQVILKVKGPTAAVLQRLKQLADSDDFRPLSPTLNLYVLHSRTGTVKVLLNLLKNLPDVAFVEPDYILKTVVSPNDPGFPQEWALFNAGVPGADIGATSAWAISTGSTANVVGVVDTGVDYTHPDLAGNIWSAPSAFTVNLSWGQLTCPAGSHGFNAINRSCDPRDDNNHGTHVSGTIGAVGNNATGVTGVNWTTRIMGLKFMDATGSGTSSDAIDAIEFALQAKTVLGANANVRVFSNSWTGSGNSQSLLAEINRANTFDALFVVAAGNDSRNNDTTPTYPASYTAPNIIAVAATTSTDSLASFSNYGRNSVHLGAPGVNVLSTVRNAAYAYYSGTSMATPHVAGAAMLVLSSCTLNTAALKSVLLANVDPVASLASLTITGGRLNVNKAIRACGTPPPPTASATFIKTDTTTSGSWKGMYGEDGFNIVGDTAGYPSYVAVTPSGASSYTWAASTADSRALQKSASATDRVAACWYSSGAFNLDLNFKDTSPHQVALYLLDYDGWGGGRSQRVDVLDANNTVLDTRNASAFGSGQYLVWSLTGHVVLRVSNNNPASNGVISGLFFGGAGAAPPPPSSGAAAFVKSDTTTTGTWKGVYGADGFQVVNDTVSYPSYVTVAPSGNSSYTWAASTTATRALQKGASSTDRIAACWYTTGSMTLDLSFKDTATHQLALYLLDYDGWGGGRAQRIDLLDAAGTVLDTRSASGFSGGLYLVWNLSGHVVVRITNNNPASNAAISGVFFGGAGAAPPPPSSGAASFIKTDSTTAGSWKGVYGADGYVVVNDAVSYPAYVTVTPSGNSAYTWAASTTDPRALLKPASSTDRIAACWYSSSMFSLDLSFKDTAAHQVALYLLDFDSWAGGRSQRIDILDGSGNLLDTRSASGFSGGRYLVWNLTGHVVLRVTNLNAASNGAMSGLFFR